MSNANANASNSFSSSSFTNKSNPKNSKNKSPVPDIDTNVNNYTIPELLAILGLDDLDPSDIQQHTKEYIEDYPSLSSFFQDIQKRLLNYVRYPSDEKAEQTQTNDWIQNQYVKQTDSIQRDKITERKQKVDVYKADEHNSMTKKHLGVANNFNVDVAQDVLNPTLKNTIERFINIDSRYRQYDTQNSTTDFTLDLSDPLTNVLNMRMYSYQIPYSWYNIDSTYGNTCLWVIDPSINTPISVTIPDGNYNTTALFLTAINQAFTTAGINPSSPSVPVINYNVTSGKIIIQLNGATYIPTSTTFSQQTIVLFFDYTNKLVCPSKCVNKSFYLDETLGWFMGYRSPFVNVDPSGNIAPTVLNITGTKYLILSIDDYNQNHLNNQLVTITEQSKHIKLPNYYSPDIPITCPDLSNNIQSILSPSDQTHDQGILFQEKVNINYLQSPQILPTAPRTLTQSQIYSINEIIKNNSNNTNYRLKAPTTTNVFSVVPIKIPSTTGQLIVEFGGSLQDNKKTYFGPVNIKRMHVQLLDDKGNVLNLNGNDWSITLIAECLYQY
jgi:hypothetical protein